MTTLTFDEDIKVSDTSYKTIADFLWEIDYQLIYDEYLERKLLEAKNWKASDFVNL